jgi:hypothetical protein
MDQTIVGDDVGHREDPVVALFGQHIATGAGECPVRADEGVVHAVHAPGHRADAVEVEPGGRGARQHARLGAGPGERPQGAGVEPHVGVEVGPRERAARLVAHPQRVRLARCRGLQDAYAGHAASRLGGVVAARVGHHDDVDLAGLGALQQSAQVGGDDRPLVVRRHYHADNGLFHAAHNNGRTGCRRKIGACSR